MAKEVQIVISARDAASQVLNQVGDAAEKNARRLANLGTSLGNVGRQMSTWVTLPTIAASAAIIKFGGEVMRTENYFRTALGDMAEEAREWADEIQDKFSFDDDDLKRDLADLMTMFDQMGVRSQQAALQMSQSLVMAARSMALLRGSGADVPQILDAMQAALMGNVRGLRRYGMDLDEAAVKTFAYKSGLAAWGSELTKGQALLARFGLIMQATKRDQEALGQSLQGPAGQLYVMQQQLQDTTDELATAFLPALLAVISAAKPVLQTIRDLAQGFKELPPNVQQGMLWFVAFVAILGPVVSAISNVVKFVGYLKAAVAGVGITGAATAPAIVALIAVIAALGYAAYKAMTDWEGFKHFWQTLWHYIVDLVLTGATKALQVLDKFLGWIPGLGDKLQDALRSVTKAQTQINSAWDQAEKQFQASRKKKQEQPTIPGLNLNLDLNALRAQLGSLGGLMEGSASKIRTAQTVLDDLAKSIAQATRLQELLGDEFDAVSAKAQAYRRAIEELVEIDPKNPRLSELVQNYQRLAAAQRIAADTQNLLNAARSAETQWAQRNLSDLQRQAAELRAQATKDKANATELLRHAAELERIDAAQKAEAILSARKDLTDKIKQLTLSERDYQLWALEQERAAFEKTYKDNADMLALFAEYYKAKWQEIIDATPQTFAEGWRAGIQEAIDELDNWGEHARDIAEETARAMQTSFSDLFFDAFTGQLRNLGDYIQNFINSVLRSISNALSSMFASFLMSQFGMGNWFGSFPAYGSGGDVRAGQPVWVGDRGRRELFVPAVDGRIIPEERLIASMSPAAAAGALEVEVRLINQGGEQMQLTRQETKVDWPRIVVTAWMEAVTRNVAGSRDFATALARG